MAVAGIVGDERAFALVHLPVSYQMRGRRLLAPRLVEECHGEVVCLVPECQFVDGTLGAASNLDLALSAVCPCRLVVEEGYGLAVFGVCCVQERLCTGLVAGGQVNPFVPWHGILRSVGVAADTHGEVSLGVGADVQLRGAFAMREDGTLARDVDPCVDAEVVVVEHDVGFCGSRAFVGRHVECHIVHHGSTVEHTRHAEVRHVGEHTLLDVLVEEDADVVASAEHAVRGLRQSERLRTRHVLDYGNLLALVVDLLVAVGGYGEYAEAVDGIGVFLHREPVAYGSRRRQVLVVQRLVLAAQHILVEGGPVEVALLAVLQAEGLQVVVVAVELAERYIQHGFCAQHGVERRMVELHGHCRRRRDELCRDVYGVGNLFPCAGRVVL